MGNVMRGSKRFHGQKWLLDTVVETIGLDWDQLRLVNTLGATGMESAADYNWVRQNVKRYDEFSPAFATAARRRRHRAEEAAHAGRLETARESYFVAAVFFGWAQWPLHDPSSAAENEALNSAKVECYSRYAELSDRRVERVEISMGAHTIPAWLHLPVGDDGPYPVMIMIPGMDTFKELQVAMYGDKFLERGFATLAIDGPGQSEALVHGLTVTAANFGDAGRVCLDWIAGRSDLDADRVGVYGRSFGSYAATVVGNMNSDRLRAVAGALVVHEPGLHTLMEEASPTFKARFMYMAGYEDEDRFDEFVRQFVLRDRVGSLTCPYLVVAGELDQLSPIKHTYDLVRRVPGPVELVVYEAERHAIGLSTAAQHGPHWYTAIADWFVERVGKRQPMSGKTFTFVSRTGEIHDRTSELED